LLQHVLKQSKSWVLSHSEYRLTPQEHEALQESLDHFLKGVPLPYILGYWEFFGRTFQLTPDVLIPRPETEMLVEFALQHAQGLHSCRIIDIGTGSGCIAISLAAELPEATVFGVDLSMAALRIAQKNARYHNLPHIHFIQADLLSSFSTQFDLICANLPYIPTRTLDALPVSRRDPHLALDGGPSGMETIRRLLVQAKTRMAPNSVLLLEVESTLGASTLASAQEVFPNAYHQLVPDLTGLDRMIKIQLISDDHL